MEKPPLLPSPTIFGFDIQSCGHICEILNERQIMECYHRTCPRLCNAMHTHTPQIKIMCYAIRAGNIGDDVVSYSFIKTSRDEDNISDQILKRKYARIIIMMIWWYAYSSITLKTWNLHNKSPKIFAFNIFGYGYIKWFSYHILDAVFITVYCMYGCPRRHLRKDCSHLIASNCI